MSPEPGQVLGGRYRLTELVAVGGMGEVWKAQDEVLAREVAAKILKPEFTGDAGFLTRFRNEARNAASLAHPNIAAVYDYGETDSAAYLVMELVPGEPLNDLMAREGPLPVPRAMRLLAQAARGLSAAHAAGVVHRDVKPGNLLITPDGRVKVTDFGIARAGDQVPLTATGQVMGTAQYLAPEQAMGRTAVPASDVYALGVVAYELLTGSLPFTADSPVAIALAHVNATPPALPETLSAGARALVHASLSKDPAQRPADAVAFAQAAEAVADGRDGDALAILPGADDSTVVAGPGYFDDTSQTRVATSAGRPAAAPGTSVLAAQGYDDQRGDDDPDAPAPAAGAGRPRRRMTTPLVALILLVVFVVIGSLLASGVLGGGDDDPGADGTAPSSPVVTTAPTTPATTTTAPDRTTTAPPTTAATPAAPDTVRVDKDRFVGRDRRAVVAELTRLGLRVKETREADTDRPAGEVLDLDPVGDLSPGDQVTVLYADPQRSTPTSPGGGGPGGGDRPEPEPTSTPTPTATGDAGAPSPTPTVTGTAAGTDGTRDLATRALTAGPAAPGYDQKDDS